MIEMKATCSHRKKFHRWQNRVGRSTRALSISVESILVPRLESAKFEMRSRLFNDPEDVVGANELHLERQTAEVVDFITISFAKYDRPLFQVHFGKWSVATPDRYIAKGSLVRKPNQYYYFWGKPWWLPDMLWSDKCAQQTVLEVSSKLMQVFNFLDSGARGSNISRSRPQAAL